MSDQIAEGKVVTIHYTLKNDDGEELDSSAGADPLPYLHGAGNIVPGLESQLLGRSTGEKLVAVVPPAEGYGDIDEEGTGPIPRSELPEGVDWEPGYVLQAQLPDGEVFPLWILEVNEDEVIATRNHPLAGVTLHFDIEIVEIRDASEEEKTHGHPHGPGGHPH